jgi:hypothetical protein
MKKAVLKDAKSMGEAGLSPKVEALLKQCVKAVNGEQGAVAGAARKMDAANEEMGRHVSQFMAAAKKAGDRSGVTCLLRVLASDKGIRVKFGALYNGLFYFESRRDMAAKYGKAPDVPMTYYIHVRHAALSLAERHALLVKAERDRKITSGMLRGLAMAELKHKGVVKETPPSEVLTASLNAASTAIAKAASLLDEGVKPTDDERRLLNELAAMATRCAEACGAPALTIATGAKEAA